MKTTGESLKQFWLQQGIKLKPGASYLKLTEFENKYNVRLPEDLKDYFSTINGFDEADADEEIITFLPLEEIEPLSQHWSPKSQAQSYFIFADFLISSHVYAIQLTDKLTSSNPVFIAYDATPVQISDSFSEFVQGYLRSDYKILFP